MTTQYPTDAALSQLRGIVPSWTPTPSPAGTAQSKGFALRDAVLGSFVAFTKPFEGETPYMYTDVKGLVTSGIGNLIDPIGQATGLPWRIGDTSTAAASESAPLATQDQVTAAWNTVKNAYPGTQSVNCHSLTNVRLSETGIQNLVSTKLLANDQYIAQHVNGYASWPADAQLAMMSMAWAMGPGFINTFTNMMAALGKSPPDFTTAAQLCQINSSGNPGVIPRNTADELLFSNAAKVQAGQGDPSVLYYLNPVGGGGVSNEPGVIASPKSAPSSALQTGLVVLGLALTAGVLAAGAHYVVSQGGMKIPTPKPA